MQVESSDTSEDESEVCFQNDSDDEIPRCNNQELPKTKNELEIPIEEPSISYIPENILLFPIGCVYKKTEDTIIIESAPHPLGYTLDSGTVLSMENRNVCGVIFETFGPVRNPFYSLRVKPEIGELISLGDKLFAAIEYSKFVIIDSSAKGTDASNVYDEEDNELYFSDDEQERLHKLKKKINTK